MSQLRFPEGRKRFRSSHFDAEVQARVALCRRDRSHRPQQATLLTVLEFGICAIISLLATG